MVDIEQFKCKEHDPPIWGCVTCIQYYNLKGYQAGSYSCASIGQSFNAEETQKLNDRLKAYLVETNAWLDDPDGLHVYCVQNRMRKMVPIRHRIVKRYK